MSTNSTTAMTTPSATRFSRFAFFTWGSAVITCGTPRLRHRAAPAPMSGKKPVWGINAIKLIRLPSPTHCAWRCNCAVTRLRMPTQKAQTRGFDCFDCVFTSTSLGLLLDIEALALTLDAGGDGEVDHVCAREPLNVTVEPDNVTT